MKITFLGTGTSQGIPVIACECEVCKSLDFRDNRTRSSVHIKVGDLSLVIDTGTDFRQQVLRERINWLDAILFTHAHKDHTGGFDDIRSYNFKQKMDIPIYGEEPVLKQIKQEFSYVFEENSYPGIPRVIENQIINKPFRINGVQIEPIRLYHHKLPVFGFRIGDFTYITDANSITEEEKTKIYGSKIVVINALQKEPHISHFNLSEALALIDELSPEEAYLTHISHRLGKHQEVSAELPVKVQIAYDGLQLNL